MGEETHATYSKVLGTQKAKGGVAPEPRIRTQGQRFRNAGVVARQVVAPSAGSSTCQVPCAVQQGRSYLMKAKYVPSNTQVQLMSWHLLTGNYVVNILHIAPHLFLTTTLLGQDEEERVTEGPMQRVCTRVTGAWTQSREFNEHTFFWNSLDCCAIAGKSQVNQG